MLCSRSSRGMFCYIVDHPGGRSARGKVHYMTPAEAHIFILNLFLFPVAHISAKPMQIKSSMTSIQRNGCKEIDLILNKYGDGL